MELMVYNSLNNKIEKFIPKNEKRVKMYVCGPTVWNYIHIGNARPVIFFDVVRRYLEFLNIEVTYASNITDIDDKIIKQAKEEGISEKEVAIKYEKAFFEDYDRLNSQRPHLIPRATEHIDDIIIFINDLIKKDVAYVKDEDVYFRVNKITNYGSLSNQQLDQLKETVRISSNAKKENVVDFTLWKKTTKGLKWKTPFGEGRPGWHTECVVMLNKIFNEEIDIHGGGSDLKFPHHENEIAQSNACFNHNLSKYWMHVGRILLDGEKMSKSSGNGIYVKDYKTVDELMTLRLLIIAAPYRSNINYTEELINSYKSEYDKIKRAYKQAYLLLDYNEIDGDELDTIYVEDFKTYMNADFNTPNVMSLIHQIVKDVNNATKNSDLAILNLKFNTLNLILGILGIKIEVTKLDDNLRNIYSSWLEARKNKDFVKADQHRSVLVNNNIL